MSTAAISNSTSVQGAQYFQDRKIDLQQLGQALQAGNLAGAQQSFAAIQLLGQNGPFANGKAFAVPQRQVDFNAIGESLQSGDIAGAQQALSLLQATFKSANVNKGVLDPGPAVVINLSAQAAAAATSTTPAGATSTTTSGATGTPASGLPSRPSATGPEIVLNFGTPAGGSLEEITLTFNNTGSGAEQLTVEVGTQQNQNTQQVTLNLAQNTNEQIVLNLLGPAASSSLGASSSFTPSSGVNVVA
ncbi:MAG TPA: hypothetical protein VI386_12260 [Candidatus Sulfotelmatobacter sp.]